MHIYQNKDVNEHIDRLPSIFRSGLMKFLFSVVPYAIFYFPNLYIDLAM